MLALLLLGRCLCCLLPPDLARLLTGGGLLLLLLGRIFLLLALTGLGLAPPLTCDFHMILPVVSSAHPGGGLLHLVVELLVAERRQMSSALRAFQASASQDTLHHLALLKCLELT